MATTKKFRVKHGLDAGNNTISFVNDPVSANDAATKNYVDIQVAAAPGDVANSYLTSTFTTNTAFQSYVANTNTRIDTLEAGGTLVTNSYLTSTFTTNTVFQSALANTNAYIGTVEGDLNTQEAKQASDLANTNAYIATKTDDTTVLATNTALRVLIDDRIQVANADAKYATWTALTTSNTAIRSYVDTEVAALVNSAPVTLNTLNELADALGDDPNFATTLTTNLGQKLGATASVTLTGDVTGSGSFSSNAVSIALTDTNLGNTNAYIASESARIDLVNTNLTGTNTALRTLISDRMQVANVISYTAKYLEVANVAASIANTSTSNATYTVANSTITFTRADSSTFDVVVDSASVEVSNTAPSSPNEGDMWWDSATGELYIYYGTNWVEAVAQDVTPYANNGTFSSSNNTITFTRTDGSQFDVVLTGVGEVTNAYVTSTFTTNTVFQSALANTNAYIATKTDDTTVLATNTALRTLINDRIQVANVTGTYVTNTVFQSALANTNAYIATKTDDTVVLATNTALRTLIDDRMQVANVNVLVNDRLQVANADAKYATWSSLTSTNTAIRAYVDTEVAALVNSAPATLDTLNELAAALGDDANFATTVTTNLGQKLGSTATVTLTGDVTGTASFSANAMSLATTDTNLANTNAYIATKTDDSTVLATNTALRTLIDDRVQVANLNTTIASYWPSANIITYTAKYLEVANSSTGTSVTVSNSAPAISANGELWWDNATGELYVAYNSAWVEAVAQDVTPYANNGTFSSSNNTITFVRTDGSQFDVVLTGVGEVTNSYVTSTFTTNTVFQSALANTNAYIATKTDDTTVLATNTALRTLIDDRIQVANVTSTYVTNTVFQSALANTNAYIATKTDDTVVLATNTALRALISDRVQVANADAKYATWTSLTSTNTAIRTYVDTEVAALVNSAPSTLDTLNELAAALGDDANFSTTITTNLSQKLGATASVTLTGDVTGSGSFSSNAVSIALTDTNLGNTNARIDLINTNLTSTNTAVRTLINDRIQVANLNTTLADYWPSANIITYTAKYLEVANSSSGTSLTVSNTAPSITANGELWWDNSVGELYVSYSNNWVEAVAQDVTPYTNNVSYSTSNTTLTFTRTDASQFDVFLDLSGVSGEVSNSYLTSTFVTNTDFQSALANTNAFIATKTDDTTVLATNTALRVLISDRMQVANVEAYLANTNSYIATESARIDLVNTNLTGTNTALRTLISDRIQVANADTRFLRKDGTALQSVGGQVTFSDNVIISGNLTVSGTRTEVNTEQLNVSNTYILLNSDLSSGTAATENAGLIVNRGSEANVYFRWNETNEYWEYGEADGTFVQIGQASATTINARNESGSQIDAGTPVYVTGYSGGGARPLVAPADADDPAKMPALGLALETVATGNNIRVASYGVYENANTGVFSEGDELYIDTTAGKLTATRPSGNSTKIQKIGQVLRSHASAGTILIQGAGRSNDIPNLSNLNVFIGNTSGVGTTRQLQYSDLSDVGYVTANTISINNPANYHEYTVTVDTKTSAHPYSGSGSSSAYFLDGVESPSIILAPNQTYRFDQSDSTNSSHPLDFYVDAAKNASYTTGVTVSGTAGSAGAYTEIVVGEDTPQVLYYQCQSHGYMGSVASILSDTSPQYLQVANSTSFITSTALTPYLEVANVATELAPYWPSANVIAYTAKYLEVANNTGGSSLEVSNTAPSSPSEGDMWYDTDTGIINIYIGTAWVESTVNLYAGGLNNYLQVANVASNTSTTSATLSGNTATFTRADSSTFTLDLSGIASSGGGGASVTVSTTAPSSPSVGDQWFDSEDAIMYIYYDSHWVEVQASQQTLTPYEIDVATFTANGTATAFTHTSETVAAKDMIVTVDGVIQRPTTDYTVSSKTVTFGSAPANTSIVAVRVTTGAASGVTNAVFQSALANTNAYIASTAATEQTNLANTNAYIATKLDSANSFSAVTVSGGNTILTTTTGTELNIVAGNNMIIDANDTTKTLTISSSASGGGGGASTGTAIAMALIFG